MYNPKRIRKLTVGGIKDGFHWTESSTYRIPDPDDEANHITVSISNILRYDATPDSPLYWNILVRKAGSLEEFFWKRHIQGKESVTEEYYLSV